MLYFFQLFFVGSLVIPKFIIDLYFEINSPDVTKTYYFYILL